MAVMLTKSEATIDDLYNAEGKAELVDGEIQLMSPTGDDPSNAAFEIAVSLREYARRTGVGRAKTDNAGFTVNLPRRKSFSPDVAFHTGPGTGMKFRNGAPVFAVEVRSENDYSAKAELRIAAKRADYFAAGTLVVWDVDLLGEEVIKSYRVDDPDKPTVYRREDVADAEPAVPGWSMAVADLFA